MEVLFLTTIQRGMQKSSTPISKNMFRLLIWDYQKIVTPIVLTGLIEYDSNPSNSHEELWRDGAVALTNFK
jgi:hypothetical protein